MIALLFSLNLFGQTNFKRYYVRTTNLELIPNLEGRSNSSSLNQVLNSYNIFEYQEAFPGTKTPSLREYYKIGLVSSDSLLEQTLNLIGFEEVYKVLPSESLCNTPTPYVNDWLFSTGFFDDHALRNINAYCAWQITTGNPNIVVGVMDNGFDITHEDLNGQFAGVTSISPSSGDHGTEVSSCVSAKTNNNIGVASIGYNTKVWAYVIDGSNILDGVWQAYLDGRKIINVSWSGISSPNPNIPPLLLAINEITQNGTVITVSAGNSPGATFHASYSNIPGVINVSGVDQNKMHGPTNHAHNQWVDICAPSIKVGTCATGTNNNNPVSNNYNDNFSSGTSLAAPIVAGTIALMLDVNPCLTPDEIEKILKATAQPILDASSFPNGVGAGMLDAHRAVEMAAGLSYPALNSLWTGDIYVGEDITVNSGQSLNIANANIHFAEGKSIIIEPGGQVKSSNSRFYSNCSWRGIKVKGIGNQHQFSIPNSGSKLYQGLLKMDNSIIENAEEAVEVVNDNGWQSGGIVQAVNCTFRNNVRSVSFQSYHNFNPNNPNGNQGNPYLNELNNRSYFQECDFLINRNLTVGYDPIGYVTMWDVKGIQFNGCKFVNSNQNVTSANQLGTAGIYSEDAEFYVSEYCNGPIIIGQGCPSAQSTPSEFINLRAGIRAKKISGNYRFTVGNSKFKDCIYGIYNEGHDKIVAYKNDFKQGNNITQPTWDYGFLDVTGTGYIVEENKFERNQGSNSNQSFGTIIQNSGQLSNEIYKNYFNNVSLSNWAIGVNRKNDPIGNQLFQGLEYRCNDMLGSVYDIYVTGSNKDEGINSHQGLFAPSVELSAGNLFSLNNNNPESDFANYSWWPIKYIFDNTDLRKEPMSISVPGVNKVFTNSAYGCPSKYGKQVVRRELMNTNQFSELNTSTLINEANLSTLKHSYRQLIDGGNTDAQIAQVVAAIPSQAQQVYASLASKSPYLSEDVLREAVQKEDILSNAMLFDLLAANPDGIKSEDFKRLLEEKNNPFPDYWLEALSNQNGVVTARTLMEALLSMKQRELDVNTNLITIDVLSDTNGVNYNLLRTTLERNTGLHNDYLIFDALVDMGDFSAATQLLNDIPSKYRMSPEEQAEFQDFDMYARLLIEFRANGRHLKDLSLQDEQILASIAANGNKIGNIRAKNWIQLNGGVLDWYEPVAFPSSHLAKKSNKKKAEKPTLISIQPNPTKAANGFWLQSNNGEALSGQLTIIDAAGKEIVNIKIDNQQVKLIPTESLQKGVYILRWIDKMNGLQSEKLIVQ